MQNETKHCWCYFALIVAPPLHFTLYFTQGIELGTEAIPGCVLQTYVVLRNPEEAGIGALISIGISTLTTGFASALISFDKDVDVLGRKDQPTFYGYIPDDHATRGRCFFLMTIMSALHNLSRSIGCALLAASSSGKMNLLYFVGGYSGEMIIFLVWKILRRDFFYWVRIEGPLAFLLAFFNRFVVKIIVDFSGCLHMRHP